MLLNDWTPQEDVEEKLNLKQLEYVQNSVSDYTILFVKSVKWFYNCENEENISWFYCMATLS